MKTSFEFNLFKKDQYPNNKARMRILPKAGMCCFDSNIYFSAKTRLENGVK